MALAFLYERQKHYGTFIALDMLIHQVYRLIVLASLLSKMIEERSSQHKGMKQLHFITQVRAQHRRLDRAHFIDFISVSIV